MLEINIEHPGVLYSFCHCELYSVLCVWHILANFNAFVVLLVSASDVGEKWNEIDEK